MGEKKIGIIITDGRTFLVPKGPGLDWVKFGKGIRELQETSGAKTLMIDTVPLPDSPAILISVHFRGSSIEFEKVVKGIESLRAKVALDTVPLPEMPRIGTWPVPDRPENTTQWLVSVRSN